MINEHFIIDGSELICNLCVRKGDKWLSKEFKGGTKLSTILNELATHWNERHQYDHLLVTDEAPLISSYEVTQTILQKLEDFESRLRKIEWKQAA